LPPPKRRFGRRINRIPGAIAVLVVLIISGAVAYTLYDRAQDEIQQRMLALAPPSGADPSGVLKNAPSGYIPAMGWLPPAAAAPSHPPDDRKKDESKKDGPAPADDNGLEKQRQAAWARYWTEYEQVRKQRFDKRFEALTAMKTSVEAPAAAGGGAGGTSSAAATPAPPALPSTPSYPGGQNQFQGWWGGGSGGFGGLGPAPQIDRESQEQKVAFAAQAGDLGKNDIVPTVHKPPMPNALMAGSYIKMVSENEINSDVPGAALGRVIESVYNTSDGQCVLIPQGSKIIGHYNSVVSAGQSRLPGVMTRIIFPDGSSQAIGAMEAADNAGSAGWDDQVDRHLPLKFGSAAIAGAFGAAIQLSVPQNNGFTNGYSPPQLIGSSLGQQMGQLGQQMAQQNLSIPNTMVIRAGYQYTIITDKDVIMQPFSCDGSRRAPYRPIMTVDGN
jgi:type IV secretion system protein VirB10